MPSWDERREPSPLLPPVPIDLDRDDCLDDHSPRRRPLGLDQVKGSGAGTRVDLRRPDPGRPVLEQVLDGFHGTPVPNLQRFDTTGETRAVGIPGRIDIGIHRIPDPSDPDPDPQSHGHHPVLAPIDPDSLTPLDLSRGRRDDPIPGQSVVLDLTDAQEHVSRDRLGRGSPCAPRRLGDAPVYAIGHHRLVGIIARGGKVVRSAGEVTYVVVWPVE